jgi:hypothetical protein
VIGSHLTGARPRANIHIVLLLFAVAITPVACRPTSRWEEADKASKGKKAVSGDALPGSAFNKFFPESGKGVKVTYTQEKKGFAEAKLELDGKEVATLSISDTVNNPSALEKFESSDDKLDSYPLATVGSKGTAILVADRFQVQVRSEDASFDRESWLSEFDLDGLGGLK